MRKGWEENDGESQGDAISVATQSGAQTQRQPAKASCPRPPLRPRRGRRVRGGMGQEGVRRGYAIARDVRRCRQQDTGWFSGDGGVRHRALRTPRTVPRAAPPWRHGGRINIIPNALPPSSSVLARRQTADRLSTRWPPRLYGTTTATSFRRRRRRRRRQ